MWLRVPYSIMCLQLWQKMEQTGRRDEAKEDDGTHMMPTSLIMPKMPTSLIMPTAVPSSTHDTPSEHKSSEHTHLSGTYLGNATTPAVVVATRAPHCISPRTMLSCWAAVNQQVIHASLPSASKSLVWS